MSWRSRLQAGSFRGVAFHTETASGKGGRRVAVHQYPQQEEHWAEDLGQSAKADSLDMYVLGDNYDVEKDALFAALDKPGSGTLIHPYLGALDVQMAEYSWTISSKQGGYCKITVAYTRAGQRKFPVDKQQNSQQLLGCCDVANTALQNDFATQFSILSQPAFVLQGALDQLNKIINLLDSLKLLGRSLSATNSSDSLVLSHLIQKPADLATGLSALLTAANSADDTTLNTVDLYHSLVESLGTDDTTPIATPSRAQQADNQQAINTLISGLATIESATAIAASDATFPTYNAAIATQESLLTQLDTLIERSPNLSYYPLANLQSAIIKRVDDLAPGLQQIEHIQLAQTLPALVLAHQLYQSSDKADELILRNQISHPLFVPAGVELEVLT